MQKEHILDAQHWVYSDYRQRITTKEWKALLLNDDDRIIFHGRATKLISINLGYGVIEVSKK